MDDLLNYEGLVGSIVNKYSKYFDREDLFQVGMLGLINAYKNFDSSSGTKFSTYAYYYVLGEIKKYIRDTNQIKISRDLLKLNNSIAEAREVMKQRLGRNPTDSEISIFLEIDYEKLLEVQSATLDFKSLDYFDDNGDLYDYIGSNDKSMDIDFINLHAAVDSLSCDEQEIIVSRYFQDMTQQEVSKKLGISQVQVSRREGKILEKLRQKV